MPYSQYRCICGLLKDRTRILVTHQIQLLNKADNIVVIENGKINESGPLSELTKKGIDFTKLLLKDDVEDCYDEGPENELILVLSY